MRIDFFTCAANGMPFIQHHLPIFEKLAMPWRWHIFEGISKNLFVANTIYPDMHRDGLSVDGTTEYLDAISNHPHVSLRRVNAQNWHSLYLTERFAQMVASVQEPTLAWELDVDEYWTVQQIETMAKMFEAKPEKTGAWFLCRCFVGPCLMLFSRNEAGNRCSYEWKRVWRQRPGLIYTKHDPPVIVDETGVDVFTHNPFTHDETEAAGLVFDHYAYVLEKQVEFKERRYGFVGALKGWQRLQQAPMPADIYDYLPCLGHGPVQVAHEEHCW